MYPIPPGKLQTQPRYPLTTYDPVSLLIELVALRRYPLPRISSAVSPCVSPRENVQESPEHLPAYQVPSLQILYLFCIPFHHFPVSCFVYCVRCACSNIAKRIPDKAFTKLFIIKSNRIL
ncbi:unnamed protein product [Nezara viridula]|uniref:Uncharacterized protein n=1 Tax=Nezara viridula TaxID=85310 RepID=A0A9P0H0W4_NEZVI|nr:unnamed protein product [Nezara viridula]